MNRFLKGARDGVIIAIVLNLLVLLGLILGKWSVYLFNLLTP